jgi:hypothetical protein
VNPPNNPPERIEGIVRELLLEHETRLEEHEDRLTRHEERVLLLIHMLKELTGRVAALEAELATQEGAEEPDSPPW